MRPIYGYVILTLLVFGAGWLAFGSAWLRPNDYFFSPAGDGYKAYFATQYYLTHQGEGAWHRAFQYPFGNHMLYMDMNPLLTRLLAWGKPVVDLTPYSVGITNLLMMLSLFFSAWLLASLLRRCHLPWGLTIPFALVFSFFSPQIDRMTGHLSLAITCYVPLIWYSTLRIYEAHRPTEHTLWLLVYGTVVSLFAFMHPYYGLLGAAWLLTYLLIYTWQQKPSWPEKWPLLGGQILAALLPIILVKGWEWATQQGPQDLVRRPFGQIFYRAGPETLFLPMHEPFVSVWNSFFKVRTMTKEGYAYIGLAGTFILISLVWRAVEHLMRGKTLRVRRPVLPAPLQTSLWTGALLLIPAMAYPMYLWPEMVEYFGPLRQFRSLGRLAWLFWYPFMVFAAWWLYALYRNMGRVAPNGQLRRIAAGLIGLALFSWMINAMALVKSQRRIILQNDLSAFPERQIDYEAQLDVHGYKAADFQAILGLPAFHVGSEKFHLSTDGYRGERVSMAVALQTGLSLCNGLAARSSLSAAKATLQLTAHPLIPKILPDQFPNDKPLLLITVPGQLSAGAEALLRQAKPIMALGDTRFYELPLSTFNQSARQVALARFSAIRDSLTQSGLHFFTPGAIPPLWESFGDADEPLGQGVVRIPRKKGSVIWRSKLPEAPSNTRWEVSFWVKIEPETNYLPIGYLRQYVGGEQVSRLSIDLSRTHDIWGEWAKVTWTLDQIAPAVELDIWLKGEPLVCDQLMIRPVGVDVYTQFPGENRLCLNNYPLFAQD